MNNIDMFVKMMGGTISDNKDTINFPISKRDNFFSLVGAKNFKISDDDFSFVTRIGSNYKVVFKFAGIDNWKKIKFSVDKISPDDNTSMVMSAISDSPKEIIAMAKTVYPSLYSFIFSNSSGS